MSEEQSQPALVTKANEEKKESFIPRLFSARWFRMVFGLGSTAAALSMGFSYGTKQEDKYRGRKPSSQREVGDEEDLTPEALTRQFRDLRKSFEVKNMDFDQAKASINSHIAQVEDTVKTNRVEARSDTDKLFAQVQDIRQSQRRQEDKIDKILEMLEHRQPRNVSAIVDMNPQKKAL